MKSTPVVSLDRHRLRRTARELAKVYRERTKLTKDMGGSSGTSEFADAVIQALANAA